MRSVSALAEHGYEPGSIPFVIQYDKRDLPGAMSVEELRAALDPQGVPELEASAISGEGVY